MIIRWLNRLEEGAISLLLVTMTLLTFYEVIMRFGFGRGLLWVEELTLLLSGWFVLFGTSYGIKVGSHIGVDFVVKALPDPLRRGVAVLAVAGGFVYCVLFIIGAWGYLDQVHMIGLTMEDLPLPLTVAHSILIIGFLMIMLRLAVLLWDILTGRADGFRFTDEAKKTLEHMEHVDQQPGASTEHRPGRREGSS